VPGLPGVSVISDQLAKSQGEVLGFRNPFATQNVSFRMAVVILVWPVS
jgi:hypothetical protein